MLTGEIAFHAMQAVVITIILVSIFYLIFEVRSLGARLDAPKNAVKSKAENPIAPKEV